LYGDDQVGTMRERFVVAPANETYEPNRSLTMEADLVSEAIEGLRQVRDTSDLLYLRHGGGAQPACSASHHK
jgi:hypothetical protein